MGYSDKMWQCAVCCERFPTYGELDSHLDGAESVCPNERTFKELVEREFYAQTSKNVLGFSADVAQSQIGLKAGIERSFEIRSGFTPAQEKAYCEYRQVH